MLPEPLTDYLVWVRQAIGRNVAAGEDVRWLQEADARVLERHRAWRDTA
jgi:hypothetical protein